jgi:hypothetical protein
VLLRRRLGVLATLAGLVYVVLHTFAPAVLRTGEDEGAFPGRLLVYGRRALTPAQVEALRSAVPGPTTAVYGGEVAFVSGRSDYPLVLVQAFTVDPRSYAAAARTPSLERQLKAGVVLSRTGAALRHASAGSTLTLATGRRLTVSAVVDDTVIAGYELATSEQVLGSPAGERASYLLVSDGGDEKKTAKRLRDALPDTDLRVLTRTQNGFFSSADTVLTQAQIKTQFGEFALARDSAGDLSLDPTWRSRWITRERVPQLGTVTCNRAVLPDLRAAMEEVTRRGLGHLVHTADFQRQGGCWNPRITRFGSGQLSTHAWGIAVDINVDDNPLGAEPVQDPRLVDIMARHGFTWGGDWLRPDGAHFEWRGKEAD